MRTTRPEDDPVADFRALGYRSLLDDSRHAAVVNPDLDGAEDVLVRVRSACSVGDLSHAVTCDCHTRQEEGDLVYLSRAGHDPRDHHHGSQILDDLEVGPRGAVAWAAAGWGRSA